VKRKRASKDEGSRPAKQRAKPIMGDAVVYCVRS
jgi:hypothetical protein